MRDALLQYILREYTEENTPKWPHNRQTVKPPQLSALGFPTQEEYNENKALYKLELAILNYKSGYDDKDQLAKKLRIALDNQVPINTIINLLSKHKIQNLNQLYISN